MQCPLLCKEFIVDVWQIYYARTKGADAILLIAAVLPDHDIRYMIKICKMLSLAAIIEVLAVISILLPEIVSDYNSLFLISLKINQNSMFIILSVMKILDMHAY